MHKLDFTIGIVTVPDSQYAEIMWGSRHHLMLRVRESDWLPKTNAERAGRLGQAVAAALASRPITQSPSVEIPGNRPEDGAGAARVDDLFKNASMQTLLDMLGEIRTRVRQLPLTGETDSDKVCQIATIIDDVLDTIQPMKHWEVRYVTTVEARTMEDAAIQAYRDMKNLPEGCPEVFDVREDREGAPREYQRVDISGMD